MTEPQNADILKLCKIYHLDPDKVDSITLSFSSDPYDAHADITTVCGKKFVIMIGEEMDGIKL